MDGFDDRLDALDRKPGGDTLEGTGYRTGGGKDIPRVAQGLAECVPDAVPRAGAEPILEDARVLPSVGAYSEWGSTTGRVCGFAVARGAMKVLF